MSNKSTNISKENDNNDKKDIQTIQKQKVTSDIKEYHKNYQQTEKWKEYFSTYLDEHKDNLNGRLKQNRLINKELITIITNCIIEKSIFFLHIEDVDKCCNLLKLNMPNSMRKELIHNP